MMSPMIRYESLLTMSSKKYKNIYINGCSYTAGHNIPEQTSWPQLLGNKLELNTICRAVNGQSFDSIFLNTINHLSMLDSKDTLVVIGTTWSTRYSVSFENITANITPVDLVGQNKHKDVKTNFEDKIRQDRRISSPYTIDKTELNKLYSKFYKNGDWSLPTEKKKTFDKLMMSFVNYYESMVELDDNLINNQHIDLMSKLVALQGFLEKHNFNYRIVDFHNVLRLRNEKVNLWKHPINEMLDDKNIVYFDGEWREKYIDGHPTQKGCYNISEVLYDSFNR